jgi:hypothetical protein
MIKLFCRYCRLFSLDRLKSPTIATKMYKYVSESRDGRTEKELILVNVFVKTAANIISVRVLQNRFYPVRKVQSIVIPKSKSSALLLNPWL